jgi:DNA-binding Xre family transcriptional regulator
MEKGHCGGSSIIGEELATIEELTRYIIIGKPKDIPESFKEWRRYRNLTLRDVEIKTGISNSYLSQLETGKVDNPSFEIVCKLCECYSVRLIVGS